MFGLPGRIRSQTLLTVLPVLLLLFVIALAAGVPAQPRGSDADADALIGRVAGYLRQHGVATAPGMLGGKESVFVDRDLYPMLVDRKGVMVAHGWTPSLNGSNVLGLKDVDGTPFIRDALALMEEKGAGSVTYKWPDPLSGKVAPKTLHVRRVVLDDTPYMLSVGVYR